MISLRLSEYNKRKLNYYSGLLAEFIAAFILKLKFFSIIKMRYRCHLGEIDIIAVKGKMLIFVEVKKRTLHDSESISGISAKRIKRSAEYFLAKHPKFTNYKIRLDLIQLNKFFLPRHYKNYINW